MYIFQLLEDIDSQLVPRHNGTKQRKPGQKNSIISLPRRLELCLKKDTGTNTEGEGGPFVYFLLNFYMKSYFGKEINKVQKAYKNIGKGVHLHLMNHSESRES